ncbi:MAG: hypothetical protein O9264_00325 [Leptospira sp.]|nr:hypothetical protein [Leptospira sp.]
MISLEKKPYRLFLVFFAIIGILTFSYWKKYDWNPSSMVNFGKEFVQLNSIETPSGAVVFLGEKGDLGAGYDGQIFYYFSRSLANFGLEWPKGFDESYRAPRIGYPFLISIFGIFGKWGSVFAMYFWNIFLLVISFFCLRSLLEKQNKYLSVLYLLNPFALASYYVLVSDSVMVSLIVIAYYFYKRDQSLAFVLISSLAILTKEPALFFLFPLGLYALAERNIKNMLLVSATLIIPIGWHLYLSYQFPNWRASRLTDFILPFEGMIRYFESIFIAFENQMDLKALSRLLSRFPLVVLFFMGTFLVFTGNIRKGWVFRLCILLTMFMIGSAGFYHFWSVYENVSRMFTISIPALILLVNEDQTVRKGEYILLTIFLLILFIVKATIITRPMLYQIGF